MNNVFREIPFSQGDKTHEYTLLSMSLLSGRITKEICSFFSLSFAGFWKGRSAENLSVQREGMADKGRVNY